MKNEVSDTPSINPIHNRPNPLCSRVPFFQNSISVPTTSARIAQATWI